MRVGFRKPSGHAVGRDSAFGSDSERIFPTRGPNPHWFAFFLGSIGRGRRPRACLCKFHYLLTGFTMKTPRWLL